jgi:hypothetical protein
MMNDLFGLLILMAFLLVTLAVCLWGFFGGIVVLLGVIFGVGDYLIPTSMLLTLAFLVCAAIKVFVIDK